MSPPRGNLATPRRQHRRGQRWQKVPRTRSTHVSSRHRGPRNRSEQFIADLLSALRISFEYEPHEFKLDLTGAGKRAIRPDNYLPEFDLYLEITMARYDDRKQAKVRSARRVHGINIVLINGTILQQLQDGSITLLQLIMSAVRSAEANPAPAA